MDAGESLAGGEVPRIPLSHTVKRSLACKGLTRMYRVPTILDRGHCAHQCVLCLSERVVIHLSSSSCRCCSSSSSYSLLLCLLPSQEEDAALLPFVHRRRQSSKQLAVEVSDRLLCRAYFRPQTCPCCSDPVTGPWNALHQRVEHACFRQ